MRHSTWKRFEACSFIKTVSLVRQRTSSWISSLNKEKRYFNMSYQQIKDWMENYEIWD